MGKHPDAVGGGAPRPVSRASRAVTTGRVVEASRAVTAGRRRLPRPRFDRPRSIVAWAALCGIAAGLVAATYFSFAGEPAIDDAIAIEEEMARADAASDAGGHDAGEDDGVTISRSTQRGAGLFGAYTVIGTAFGVLLGLAALTLQGDWLDPFRRVAVAGSILAGAVTVVPWFKYPPNPPAVGDPATADERQRWYLILIALTGLVLAGAAHLSARLRRAGWSPARRLALVGTTAALVLGGVLLALPSNDDPIPAAMPTKLIWRFRTASLTGNLILWSLLVVGFGLLWAEASRRRAEAAAQDAGLAGATGDQNSMPLSAEIPAS
jgi:predicted cobalt transporter CbtA